MNQYCKSFFVITKILQLLPKSTPNFCENSLSQSPIYRILLLLSFINQVSKQKNMCYNIF